MSCIFCNIEKDRIILENEDAFAVNDVFPVSKGHILIIPKKHIDIILMLMKIQRCNCGN